MKVIIKLLVKLAPWYFLIASIGEMGWGVSVEGKGDETVEGLVIGTDDYIDRHIPKEVKE